MEGRARVRRASEPRVEDALRRSPALRTRVRVLRRRGRVRDSGAPMRARRWVEKVSIAGRRSSLGGVSIISVKTGVEGGLHVGLDDDTAPLGDEPALAAAFDFHITNVDDEV